MLRAAVQQAASDALDRFETGEAALRDWTETNESPSSLIRPERSADSDGSPEPLG